VDYTKFFSSCKVFFMFLSLCISSIIKVLKIETYQILLPLLINLLIRIYAM